MLRNILDRHVPVLAAKHAHRVLWEVLRPAGVGKDQITGWILHAGGRDVLEALQERLELSSEDLRWSADILARFGNLSSPFVLFVLESALRAGVRAGYWWLSSFGAGFSSHGALLKVT
jgi:alkylresorcinol/alkylpyrone synthase